MNFLDSCKNIPNTFNNFFETNEGITSLQKFMNQYFPKNTVRVLNNMYRTIFQSDDDFIQYVRLLISCIMVHQSLEYENKSCVDFTHIHEKECNELPIGNYLLYASTNDTSNITLENYIIFMKRQNSLEVFSLVNNNICLFKMQGDVLKSEHHFFPVNEQDITEWVNLIMRLIKSNLYSEEETIIKDCQENKNIYVETESTIQEVENTEVFMEPMIDTSVNEAHLTHLTHF